MGTITKTVQHRKECNRQKQMRLDELTQPGWGDTAHYFQERFVKYGTSKWMVPAVVKPQTDMTAATPLPTTFGELRQTLDIVPGQSQMPQGTSRPGRSQMKQGAEKPQSQTDQGSVLPDVVANSSLIENAKPVEPISFDPQISRPKLITIYKSDLNEEMVMAPASPEVKIAK